MRSDVKIGVQRPKAKADWRLDDKGRSKLKIRMENLPGTSVNVTACGMDFGAIPVNGVQAKVSLDSKKGDTVPACPDGSTITVTGDSGLNLMGMFHDK